MSDLDIEFGEPPEAKGPQGSRHAEIARALRERPGEWALVVRDTYPSVTAYIKGGGAQAYRPSGSFEAASRTTGNGRKVDIYARYVGGA